MKCPSALIACPGALITCPSSTPSGTSAPRGDGISDLAARRLPRPRCPYCPYGAHTVWARNDVFGRTRRAPSSGAAGRSGCDADWPGASIGDGAGCSRLLQGTGRETLFCCPYYPYKMKKFTQLNASRNEPSQNVRTVRAVWADRCHSTPSLTRNSSHRISVSGDGRNRRGSA